MEFEIEKMRHIYNESGKRKTTKATELLNQEINRTEKGEITSI